MSSYEDFFNELIDNKGDFIGYTGILGATGIGGVDRPEILIKSFKQDYRLQDGDLNYTFYNDEVAYPYDGLTHVYSPYWVRYEIGRVQEGNLSYFPLGSEFRIPDEMRTGVFRPNFIIGEKWKTGLYILRWKFKNSAGSATSYAGVPFLITTSGIYDNSEEILGGYKDLPATLRIID